MSEVQEETPEDVIRRLQGQVRVKEQVIAGLQREHAEELLVARRTIHYEQQQRMAAQRGLVPYVRGLEAFNDWLRERPELSVQVEAELRANGLWDIKLGYDPDQDLGLSVISPHRA